MTRSSDVGGSQREDGDEVRGVLAGGTLLFSALKDTRRRLNRRQRPFVSALTHALAFAITAAVLVAMLRLSCGWCGLQRPGVLASLAVIVVSFVVEIVAGGVVQGGVYAGYEVAGWPLWEAAVVIFFLQLPFDLAAASAAHAVLMKIPLGKAVEVWFVQRLMLFALVGLVLGAAAAAVAVRQGG